MTWLLIPAITALFASTTACKSLLVYAVSLQSLIIASHKSPSKHELLSVLFTFLRSTVHLLFFLLCFIIVMQNCQSYCGLVLPSRIWLHDCSGRCMHACTVVTIKTSQYPISFEQHNTILYELQVAHEINYQIAQGNGDASRTERHLHKHPNPEDAYTEGGAGSGGGGEYDGRPVHGHAISPHHAKHQDIVRVIVPASFPNCEHEMFITSPTTGQMMRFTIPPGSEPNSELLVRMAAP